MVTFTRIDIPGFWRAVGRPAVAYCLACCAASLVLLLVGLSTKIYGNRISEYSHRLGDIASIGAIYAIFVAALALVPTILVIAILRRTRLRRGPAEVMVGALMGVGISSAFLFAIGGDAFLTWTILPALSTYGIAGAVAGLTYWLVLGRPRNPKAQ